MCSLAFVVLVYVERLIVCGSLWFVVCCVLRFVCGLLVVVCRVLCMCSLLVVFCFFTVI